MDLGSPMPEVLAKRLGYAGRCWLCQLPLFALRAFYRFDPWHASYPYSCAPYHARAVELASAQKPEIVVEIGCGLGEVLTRVRASHRYGLDQSPQVLRAARLLHGARARFETGSLQDADRIAEVVRQPIDLLIMTNWPHEFAMREIRGSLAEIRRRVPVKSLLIDTIHPGLQGYRHWHTVDDLRQLGRVEISIDGTDGLRDLNIVRLEDG